MKTQGIKKLLVGGIKYKNRLTIFPTMAQVVDTLNEVIDSVEALEKSINVKAIEDMNNRLFALERMVGEIEKKKDEIKYGGWWCPKEPTGAFYIDRPTQQMIDDHLATHKPMNTKGKPMQKPTTNQLLKSTKLGGNIKPMNTKGKTETWEERIKAGINLFYVGDITGEQLLDEISTVYQQGRADERKRIQKIDHSIDVRYEEDTIKAFNKFIKKWCGVYYAHLIDSDENDGQFMREKIALHQSTRENV